MAAPLPVKDWSDFGWFTTTYLPAQTISTLRQFAAFLEQSGGVYVGIRTGERKDSIVEKTKLAFQAMQQRNDFSRYQDIRQKCDAVGKPVPNRSYYAAPPPTFGGVPAGSSSSSSASMNLPPYRASAATRPTGSGWGSVNTPSNVYTQHGSGAVHTLQDWKKNPLWKPIKAITSMEMLPDIVSTETSHTRKEKRVTFHLPVDAVEKLSRSKANPNVGPHYSLRVFCTSSDHYRPANQAYYSGIGQISNQSIPIEYPASPDMVFDGQHVAFKERGLRGKAGSAPPFDLAKNPIGVNFTSSRLYAVVMGHTGPTTGKKKEITKRFYFQVVLAEMTTKDELLERLMRLVPTSAEEALAAARRRVEDDDIIPGASKMTLKDPLSYMRITQPIRSTLCSHIQCFDAKWWIESNAQHPQFLCPLCNKSLNFDDLIVDGYFLSILNALPDSVEEVIVEADYKWRTEDNKYSSEMKEQPAPELPTPSSMSDSKREESRQPTDSASPKREVTTGKRKAIEILSSDDDDEDDMPLARQNRPTIIRTPSASASASVPPANNTVIDLTLSDSEDEEEPQYFRQPGAGTDRDAADSTRQSQAPKLPEMDTGARLNLDTSSRSLPPLSSSSGSNSTYPRPLLLPSRLRESHRVPEVDINPLDMDYGIPTHGNSYATDQWVNPEYRSGYSDGAWNNPGTINPSGPPRPLERWSDVREGKRPRPTASEWMDEEFQGEYRGPNHTRRS